MEIYLLIIIWLFVLSYRIKAKFKFPIFSLFLLMIFLCFGYMTGSDWRNYETEYYSEFSVRLVEPGYMLLSNLFSRSHINFWVFHIFFKCVFYIFFISFICNIYVAKKIDHLNLFDYAYIYSGTNRTILCGIMMWVASFGFFMLINCPFRNVISCAIMLPAFVYLFRGKIVYYYLFTVLAISFHFSAVLMLFLPLVKLEKVSSKCLVLIYMSLLILLSIGGSSLLLNILAKISPSILYDRITFYEDSELESSVFSVGLLPRLLCLWAILRYRSKICANFACGNKIVSLCYFYLLLSLIYCVYPLLFRCALFLSPFYILGIICSLSVMKINVRKYIKVAWLVFALGITVTTVQTPAYVPYSNIITSYIMGGNHSYFYRDNYNNRVSPYRFEKK